MIHLREGELGPGGSSSRDGKMMICELFGMYGDICMGGHSDGTVLWAKVKE